MKKFISIMAAGVLLLSSVSALAAAELEVSQACQTFDGMSKVTALTKNVSTNASGQSGIKDHLADNDGNTLNSGSNKITGFYVDNLTNIDGWIGDNRGTTDEPDWALKFQANSGNAYLTYSRAMMNKEGNTVFETDLKISGNGGVRVTYAPHYTSYLQQRSVIEFSSITEGGNTGSITAYGYKGSVEATWTKDTWYTLRVTYKATGTANDPTYIELMDENGNVLYKWIGVASQSNASYLTTHNQGRINFISQGATTFSIDNFKVYKVKDADLDSPYTCAYPAQLFNIVADGAVADDIADVQGKTVSAEFAVKETSLAAVAPKIFIASYDAQDRFINVNLANASLSDAAWAEAELSIPVGAAKVKAFVWDVNEGMYPLVLPEIID